MQDRSTRVTTPHFVLLLAPRPAGGPCRLGVVASKKIGGAVVRNRAKRLLREVFRTRPTFFPAHVDLVVIARNGAAELSFATVARELQGVASLLQRRARDLLRHAAQEPAQELAPAFTPAAKPAATPPQIAPK